MPLAEEYKAALKSDIADLKNIGGRVGHVVHMRGQSEMGE
jgi:leucyl aminopeptidase